jgi:CheY-like chemotaxis protein
VIFTDASSASPVPPVEPQVAINTSQSISDNTHAFSATNEKPLNLTVKTEPTLTTIISSHVTSQPVVKPALSDTPSVNPKEFTVLLVHSDPAECEAMAQLLDQYNIDIVHDGLSALSRLISLKTDLVILGVDLPIIDGFEVLSHIRRSLNVPVIAISATRVRAGDRILASEMGADYYLTKPYSSKELRQKVRQLIARYRGVNSWIVTSDSSATPEHESARRDDVLNLPRTTEKGLFLPYEIFSAEVELRVKTALERGPAISIVGCSLPHMTSEGGKMALQLFDLMRATVRDTDRISSNQKNDLVILLPDADSNGGQAFARRLRERVRASLNLEPAIWLRSFPDLKQTEEPASFDLKLSNGHKHNRRIGDKRAVLER